MQLLGQLLTHLLVVRIIGVGADTDAYIAAQAVPSVLGAIVITALQSVWLPRLAVLSGDMVAWRHEQSIAQGQGGILGGGLLLLFGVTITWWLPLLYAGFTVQQQQTTIELCLVMLVGAGFNTQSALLTIALRARDRFVSAEWISLVGILFSIIAMYIALPIWGLAAAVWISLLRAIVVYLALMHLASWPPLSFIKGWFCNETWILMRPLLFGVSIYKTSSLVDRYWASQAPAGAITILSLAQTGMGALATILERAICMPITPILARHVAQSDYAGLRRAYRSGILRVTIVVVCFGVLLIVLKPMFVEVIATAFNIQAETATILWLMCLILMGYLHAAAAGAIVIQAFYAMGNTKTPVKIGFAGFLLSLGVKAIGYLWFGLLGLALGTTIYYSLNMLVMWIILESTINNKGRIQARSARNK